MFHYVTLGSNDLPRSKRFYDAALGPLGIINTIADDSDVAYAETPKPGEKPVNLLWVLKPLLALPANWGNGTMIVFTAKSRAAVDAFYAGAMANGGIDEGAPGLRRYSPNFYACYVRDPDGNKLSAVYDKPE
jgi:catechol 2,3-dioxygenase-like lactoylglutathione lyase family enzyme